MSDQNVLLTTIFVPIAGAMLLPLFGRFSSRLRNLASLLLVSLSLCGAFYLLPGALQNQPVTIYQELPLGFNFVFKADLLAVFMAIVSSFIGAVIVIYSFDYISHYENQNEYYLMVVLFLSSMTGLVFSANLILLYIFWEITAITSWRLIGFFREKTYVLKADKSFLVTMFGALLMLTGFLILYQEAGSFDLEKIRLIFQTKPLSQAAVLLILAGIFSKSATLPFHTWLPDAGVAPSPVTALLHAAVLVKIGVYVFARLFVVTIPLVSMYQDQVMIIAAISALVSAGAALVETDLKRIIAYSTVSQIGFIFFGLASGNIIGIAGGLLYILMHGLAKGGLFLCAGIVEQNAKTKDITKLGGLIAGMPITAISFLFCAFSVMGIPPFGGFFSKYMVIAGGFGSGRVWIPIFFIAGAVMTVLYLFRVFSMIFLGESKAGFVKEGSPVMVFCVASLALLSLAGGALIYYPNHIVHTAVLQIVGAGR